MSLIDREFGGVHEGTGQMVDPDAIQEVRVETAVSGAQFAAPSTVIINTKSGTNQLHGSLFETALNSAFGVARTRQDQANFVAPHYVRNEFGGSIGGPIVIPHVYDGRNKSFFFFAYERFSLAQAVSQNQSVPTMSMRGGDFSGLVNSSGVLQQLYDPATTGPSANCNGTGTANAYCRTPFLNNQIPLSRESPTAKVFNAMTPLPTNGNNPLVQPNLSALLPELQVEPQITFRLDQTFNEKNRAYLRYTQNISNSILPRNDPAESYTLAATTQSGAVIPAGASGVANDPDALFAAALGYTHVFSPTFVSETILSQQWMGERNYAGGAPFTNYESELGLPNNFGEAGFPYIESIFQPIDGTQFQYGMTSIIAQVDENLTKTLGAHQLLFGGRYRFERFGSLPDELKDQVVFNGLATALGSPSTYSSSTPTAQANTGQLNADEFLGSASSYGVNLQPPYQHLHDNEFDLYLQDNYRLRKNLTVNLGLRYEAHPAIWMGQGAMMSFDLKNDAIVTSGTTSQLISEGLTTQAIINNDELDGVKFETAAEAGLPPMLVNSYDFTWGPRIGAAWQPFAAKWGTVLRGGLGRYIYPTPIREAYRNVSRNDPFTVAYGENYNSVQYTPSNNYLLISAPNSSSSYSYATTLAGGGTPIMGVNTSNVINTNSANAIPPGINIASINHVNPPSYVDEANLTLEQPLKWNSVLRLSYVYTHGTNLPNSFFYNDHPSTYSWEVSTGTTVPASTVVGSPLYSATGEGPYDRLTYGGSSYQIQKSGWSNYNGLQATFQKLYQNGIAWQVLYVWSKSMRTGDDFGGENGDSVEPYSAFANSAAPGVSWVPQGGAVVTSPVLPPPPPAGTPVWGYYKALNRWENYMVDTNNPPQHLQFNGLIDLPFGRGKRWLGNSNRALDEVVGGWQLAGAGRIGVTDFAINTTNWGPTNPIKVYKHGAPITDCRSGVCLKSYEWWNGYIAPTAVAGNVCAGSAVVKGLPGGWAPYQAPIDTLCSAPANGKTVVDQYYGDNDVAISGVYNTATGAPQAANTPIAYGVVPGNNDNGSSTGAIDVTNPFGHTVLQGPMNWSADISLFKSFPITERVFLRVNVDAFNVFNNQGLPNPSGSDGTVCVTPGGMGCSSYNSPRQLQFTARLSF